ncbi:MAG: hypothetical protein JW900_15165 [Anaerolineae bacterium]|nr:hypothetical protein [Anaerolineae bacterium]
MIRKFLYTLVGAAVVAAMVSAVGAQGLGTNGGPSLTPNSWSDTFADDLGLSWMDRSGVMDGQVVLSQLRGLGESVEGGDVLALTVGPDGKVYLGTDGAYLNVYDPATGVVSSLGAPVPGECFG